MSQSTQKQSSQPIQQPVGQQSSSTASASTDMSSFSMETASSYQGSLGNQGVASAAGMEAQGSSVGGGMELLTEIDPEIASRVQVQLDQGDRTASECEGVLTGDLTRCIDDIYAVQDYIWAEIDGLQADYDSGDDLALSAACERLDEYQRNLSSCVLLADSERNISELYTESALLELLPVLAVASQEAAGLQKVSDAAAKSAEAVDAELAKVMEAFGQLSDVALKAELDLLIDEISGGISKLTAPLKAGKKAVEWFVSHAMDTAKDTLFEKLRMGPEGEGADTMEQVDKQATLLNESVGLEIKGNDVTDKLAEVSQYIEYLRDIDDARKKAESGLEGIQREWDRVLHETAPRLTADGTAIAKRLQEASGGIRAEQARIEESVATFREQADDIRAQFPDRATQLG